MTPTAPRTQGPPRIIRAAPRTFASVLAMIEATASVFFAFVVGLVLIVGGGMAAVLSYKEVGLTWVLPAGAVVALAEIIWLAWLKFRLEDVAHGGGGISRIALRQPSWPILLRPLLAAWWAAHAAFAVGAMVLLERGVQWEGMGIVRSGYFLAAILFGVFTISHTTHLYALLIVTALNRSERWVYVWWRFRFLVDALVTATFIILCLRGGAG